MSRKASKTGRAFTVVIEPAEEGGYVVRVPALPGCVTQGDTVEEAKENAQEAVEAYLLGLRDLGKDIPKELERPLVMTVVTGIVLR